MNAPETFFLPDVQSTADLRRLAIQNVGVKGRRYPLQLISTAGEEDASCEVFGLLKRPDEKWVTERACDNPKFVEDLVSYIALRLLAEPRIAEWKVASENFESIHKHSAYAALFGTNH